MFVRYSQRASNFCAVLLFTSKEGFLHERSGLLFWVWRNRVFIVYQMILQAYPLEHILKGLYNPSSSLPHLNLGLCKYVDWIQKIVHIYAHMCNCRKLDTTILSYGKLYPQLCTFENIAYIRSFSVGAAIPQSFGSEFNWCKTALTHNFLVFIGQHLSFTIKSIFSI